MISCVKGRIGLHDSLIINSARRLGAYLVTFDKQNEFILYARSVNVPIINPCIFNNVNDRVSIELRRAELRNKITNRSVDVKDAVEDLYSWFISSKERIINA